jgi:hypothetical protein
MPFSTSNSAGTRVSSALMYFLFRYSKFAEPYKIQALTFTTYSPSLADIYTFWRSMSRYMLGIVIDAAGKVTKKPL